MGKTTGFKEFDRATIPYRAEADRLLDFKEIYTVPSTEHLETQGRSMYGLWRPFLSKQSRLPYF